MRFVPKKKKSNPSKSQFLNIVEELLSDFTSDMKADIKEREAEYIIEVEVPGVSKDEIRIQVEYDKVVVFLEKSSEHQEDGEYFVRRERKFDSRSRTFYLSNIQSDQTKAQYGNGILRIYVPKREFGFNHTKYIDIE